MISDLEIYERIVNELPFTVEEEEAKVHYWRQRTMQERLEAAHELLRRHYRKRGIEVDSLRMDKRLCVDVCRTAAIVHWTYR